MGEEPPEGLRYSFNAIGHEADIFKQAQLTADSGYHSEKNIELVFTEGIDFYIL